MDDHDAGFQSGIRSALLAIRNIDRQINFPERKEFSQEVWSFEYERYNTQKDLLYKIYSEIKKQTKEEIKDE